MHDRNELSTVKADMTEMITEESVVSKVQELMETLDSIKRYNAFATSFKKFTIIILGFMTVFSIITGMFEFYGLRPSLDSTTFFSVSFLALLIPIIGIVTGVLFVRRKVNSVRTGEWKEELSHGFPSALKMLVELDWEMTFDEISLGKLSYVLYGLMKAAIYWVVTFSALRLLGTAVTLLVMQQAEFVGVFFWAVLALLIVIFTLGNDLLRRYKEILSLDLLLIELRWLALNSEKPSSKPDLYVIARIIKVLKEKHRLNRTALATSTGLAYDKLVNYLGWMSERKFVEIS